MTTDADLHKQADQRKTDLSTAHGVTVDDGQGVPPKTKADPYEARKAMFEKSDRMRREGRARSGDDVVDTSGAENPDQPSRGRETLHLPAKTATAPVSPSAGRAGEGAGNTPSQDANARVSLTVNGGTIEVAQSDIDRAGGTELYLRRRELDEEAIRLQSERAALEAERAAALAESNRLREELRAGNQRTGQDGPASRTADPAVQDRNGSGVTGVDKDALAERLARQIYSGDESDARAAIAEIIGLATARGETLNEEQIAERVAARVRQTSNATDTTTQTHTVSPVVKATNDAINRMAQSEFSDVCKDEVARQATFAKLQQMMKDPANRDRRAVDVARDACEWGRSTFFNPRAGIVEQKRGLASSVAASGATSQQVDDEPEALSGQEYIQALNERRNFGRRAKP